MSRPTATMIAVQNPTDAAIVAVHERRNVIANLLQMLCNKVY